MRRARAWALAVAVAVASAGPAAAQDSTEEARTYFNAGAAAYAAGKYPAAIAAFERAYQIAPRPGILFSIAQAYRREYTVTRGRAQLERAVSYYRSYVEKTPEGGRRGEAIEALGELEPALQRLGAAPTSAEEPPPAKRETQLLVSAQTRGAEVAIDGKPAGAVPFAGAVTPGKHVIRVTAPGYVDDQRELSITEGAVVAVDVKLEERRARLSIEGPEGAEVSVDGRIVGDLPLPAIELRPGRHFVAVAANGRRPFARELTLARGERRTLTAPLEATGQRTAAWVLLGASAAGVGASGALAWLAKGSQDDAQDVLGRRDRVGLEPGEVVEYEDARDLRDAYRSASFASLGLGLALGVTGTILFAFDRPRIEAPATEGEERAPTQDAPTGAPAFELSGAPWIAPGGGGLGVNGRF